MAVAQQSGQMAPGSRFSIPPFTDDVMQPDNNDGLTTVLNSATQVPVTGVIPFMQSDVIYGWLHKMTIPETVTTGTGATVTQSPYYPFQYVGPYLLNMQYQYPSISVASGIDLALINLMRPMRPQSLQRNAWYSNLNAVPIGPQASQLWSAPAYASGVAHTPTFFLELPASCYFDSYYELDENGNPLSGPHNGYVSPQNMGGYARVVTPTVRMNPIFGSTVDSAPYNSTGGTMSTASASTMIHGFERVGVLGTTDSSVLPQPTNWQYNIAHQQVALNGKSTVSIPLNQIFAGQIMGISVRLFDPSAAAGVGAAIAVTNVTLFQLTFGGSVQKFSGTVDRLQERFANQHLFLPPEGVLMYDLATDVQGWRTNSYLLNTLRTASVGLQLNFSAALSATAYAEITIDGLRWVPLPVNPAQ
jgi:hypothetical protein